MSRKGNCSLNFNKSLPVSLQSVSSKSCLPCHRSRDSTTASALQSEIYCFLFQFLTPSRFLKVIQYLLMSSSSSSRPFYLSFSNVLEKLLPRQYATNPIRLPSFFFAFKSSLTLCNTSVLTRSVHLIFSILFQHQIFKTFQLFPTCFPKCPNFSTAQSYSPTQHFTLVTRLNNSKPITIHSVVFWITKRFSLIRS